MVHVGKMVENVLHEQGRTVTWFAKKLGCTRPNVYKIFAKENFDTARLLHISRILNYDFFIKISESYQDDNHILY